MSLALEQFTIAVYARDTRDYILSHVRVPIHDTESDDQYDWVPNYSGNTHRPLQSVTEMPPDCLGIGLRVWLSRRPWAALELFFIRRSNLGARDTSENTMSMDKKISGE